MTEWEKKLNPEKLKKEALRGFTISIKCHETREEYRTNYTTSVAKLYDDFDKIKADILTRVEAVVTRFDRRVVFDPPKPVEKPLPKVYVTPNGKMTLELPYKGAKPVGEKISDTEIRLLDSGAIKKVEFGDDYDDDSL